MPYLFTCPHCQTKTLVDDEYSGHIGRCVTCDQRIEVPVFRLDTESQSLPAVGAGNRLSPLTRRLIAALLCVISIGGLVGLAYRFGSPMVASLSTGRERARAIRNLETIATALNAYAADYGVYPAPIIFDANGKAMHSWRVAILPYLNEQQLYSTYHFDEPWDSAHNMSIVDSIPSVYVSQSPNNWGSYQCSYQLVSGNLTLFPKSGPLGPKRVTDDPAKTALVVEAMVGSTANDVWTQPTTLPFALMTGAIGSNPGVEIGSVTEGGAAIATVDCLGHFLEETTPPEIVRAILTATGNEPLADDVLD